jgi:ABC-type uncharacterized transport system substrate-binding protein
LKRRELLGLFGSAALAWPLPMRAQQPAAPVIGFLDTSAATAQKLTAFYEGLKIEGFVRNQNVMIEYHSAQSDFGRLPGLADDLVNRKVSVITSIGTPAALAAKAATSTIPIIFAVACDPVHSGLINSLNRPGGNITGATNVAEAPEQKRLELLHELVSTTSIFAFLINPTNPKAEIQTRNGLAAGRKTGLQVNVLHASAESDFDAVFATLTESRGGGLVISNDELFVRRGAQLAALAVRRAVPAIFQHREFAAAGGLMSYGRNLTETYHQAGVYSGLILKGGKAPDLPVYQSTKVEFIVNVRTARSLGLTFPLTLLGRADEVIQ